MGLYGILDQGRSTLDTMLKIMMHCCTSLRIFGVLSNILAHPRVGDAIQLIILGLIAEFARRLALISFSTLRGTFCIISTHHLTDESFDWLMTLWVQDSKWQNSCKQFDCEVSRISSSMRTMPWLCGKKDNKYDSSIHSKFAPPRARYLPCVGSSFTTWFGYTLVRFTRAKNEGSKEYYDGESLQIVMLTRSRDRFKQLLAHAKHVYLSEEHDQISIKMLDEHNDDGVWHQVATKNKRSLATVVTEPGVKEMLHREMMEFCRSGNWYASRGVPWRKGILLHGIPGSGKSSLIHALASSCDLDIHLLSLATSGLTDSKLIRCMMAVPPGCIVVIEDIDAGLPRSITSTSREGVQESDNQNSTTHSLESVTKGREGITLSGLLNAIDGVVGAEGRILFMTTNYKHVLDPALVRPGRIDITVEFTHASKTVCRELFKAFYPIGGAFPIRWPRKSVLEHDSNLSTEKACSVMTAEEINSLAEAFAGAIPESKFSSAEIQGLLMMHKDFPGDAVDHVPEWAEARW